MNQTIEPPLDIHLDFTSQCKPVHPLACPNITKHRLHNPQPSAVNAPALPRLNLLFHLICDAARAFTIDYVNLS